MAVTWLALVDNDLQDLPGVRFQANLMRPHPECEGLECLVIMALIQNRSAALRRRRSPAITRQLSGQLASLAAATDFGGTEGC